ncbi:Zonadhesin, partial [Myotis davidii]
EKPPDQNPVAYSPRDNSIITQCDFEDNSKPFCDWTQIPTNYGNWIRASGPSIMGSTGPTGGYPNGQGWYLHLDFGTSHQGWVARLLSSPIWEQGPLCVHFAYYMFGLSWGAQLKLLSLTGTKNRHPNLLWKHINIQSPSWMPTTVTVPKGHVLPTQLIFEGVRGSTAFLDISLDSVSIRRGSCNRASCPPNAHHEPCACPASCQNPKPNCELVCKPGCVCNPGFLFSDSHCINASSCNCFYNNSYYKPGAEWLSPNCTEQCHCWPGSRVQCQTFQCKENKVCQQKNGQYGCHSYGSATCFVYGDPHYLTFDGRHFSFMGKCTYILAQFCGNSIEPFFRVAGKNEEGAQEDMSCLSKVYVTLPETTVTLLRGRRTLVEGQEVNLPAMPSKGIFLVSSGRFVELQTAFGLRIRWDGDQQLFISVPSTYYGQLCGFCGNYDGDSSNDNKMPDGRPAQDEVELGISWQTIEDIEEDTYSSKLCRFCGSHDSDSSTRSNNYQIPDDMLAQHEELGNSWSAAEDMEKK